jgi:hypothetical protein
MLQPAKEKISREVQTLIELLYSSTSPWLSVTTNLWSQPVTVSVKRITTNFLERIIFCFLQQSTEALLERLPAEIATVAAAVPDSAWIESCAQQRKELERKTLNLSDAKRNIMDMLSVQNEEEFI